MRKLLFMLLLTAAGSTQAQDFQPYFAAVVVSDIDTSIAWYQKVLGLKLRNRTDAPERGFIQANLFNGEILIELVQVDSSLSEETLMKNQPPRARIRGFAKLGFRVGNIDQVWEEMNRQKIKFTGRMVTDPVSQKRTFLINDPDDNLIQFFEK